MAKGSTLSALLESESEPTPRSYNEAVEETMENRNQISDLAGDEIRDSILIILTTRSHRLAQFFCRLRAVVRSAPKSSSSSNIAAETVQLYVDLLPDLHQLLEPTKVLDFLVPALDVCFASSQRPMLRELAAVLASSGTLLEHLVSNRLGIEVIRQWVSLQSTVALDARTLELWTERLISMAHSCAIDHDNAHEIQQWDALKAVKRSLQNVEHSTILLTDDDKCTLKVFDLQVPDSRSSLQAVIKRLEGDKTTKILLSIAAKLPCYLCIPGLGSLSQTSKCRTHDEIFQAVSIPQIEILDTGLWVWKLLLSSLAKRSVLHMGSHGQIRLEFPPSHS